MNGNKVMAFTLQQKNHIYNQIVGTKGLIKINSPMMANKMISGVEPMTGTIMGNQMPTMLHHFSVFPNVDAVLTNINSHHRTKIKEEDQIKTNMSYDLYFFNLF